MKWTVALMTQAALAGLVAAQTAAPGTVPATKPSATAPATSTAPTTRPAALTVPVNPPGTFARAIILGGTGGEPAYARNVEDWCVRFHAVLTRQCGLKGEHVILLTEKAGAGPQSLPATAQAAPPRKQSTLENVFAALDETTKALTPKDQFILFIAGLGQINEPNGKLCLPGPDLDSEELVERLAKLPTRNVVIINTSPGGAQFLKSYISDDRVILSAAGAESDGMQTYFAEFFVRGYETLRADANGDGVLDLLEAYVYAGQEVCNFYHRQYMLVEKDQQLKPDEPVPWLVRGKETRQIWRRLYAGTNNALTLPKRLEKDQAPLPADLDDEPDPVVFFGGRFGPDWHYRRVLAERSRLDDTSKSDKAYFVWVPYDFAAPPEAKFPGDETYLARRTVLGATELLKLPVR